MKLLPILLLLSISAITSSDIFALIHAYCAEVCPCFEKLHPDKKIAYKEIEENCKKDIKEVQNYCAEFMKLDEIKRKSFQKYLETLTWNEACNEYCKIEELF
ncbi:unnamed protein product [Cylicocyclus nassatus]|uniref:Uncharacterized protein n=1 Tax=Cylicocyclus nassatus TaxID=53992 RepID=A0AA36HBK9_CYLNA|nr:unnamed protein product [Cylicocyclus nassatus]